ncbi:MAG: MOSC domain-containing protein [Pirellulales bacterium]
MPSLAELDAGLDAIRRAPRDAGRLELIVRRPAPGQREVVELGQLDLHEGLVGDNWRARGNRHTPDGSADINSQLTLMSSRAIALIAVDQSRWPLAGDQLFVDLDLSKENLPAGTRLAIGSAVVEVTAPPHLGCKLFANRYGVDAVKWVNSAIGKELRLRGLNARVVTPGTVRVGDVVHKV